MNKLGFAPVLQHTNRLFTLCLLGGLATLSIVDAKALSVVSNEMKGEIVKINKDNKNKKSINKIKNVVATVLAEDKSKKESIEEPFLKNAYYQEESVTLTLTRFEIEEQIRQEVALAMKITRNDMTKVSHLSADEQLEVRIREEVIRLLALDSQNAKNIKTKIIRKEEDPLGWVYLGRFKDNQWLGSPLQLGSQLPEKGKEYMTSCSVNIRKSFSALQPVMHILQPNTSVQLTDVVKRGKKGHYWAKVSML